MGIFQLAMLVYLSVSSLYKVQCLQIRYLNPLVNVMDNYRIVEVIEDEAEMTLGGFTFQRAYSLFVGSLEHLPKQRLGEGGSFFFSKEDSSYRAKVEAPTFSTHQNLKWIYIYHFPRVHGFRFHSKIWV